MHRRLESLQTKKEILDAKIDREHARPRPDTLRLQSLKRQRLKLKDRMSRFGTKVREALGQGVTA